MLHFIKSKKFKTTAVGVVIRRDLTKEECTLNALIPNILKQGSAKYPNLYSMQEEIESLYGAVFDASIIKKGEEQVLQFFIEVIKKDDLTEKAINFLKEIILNPLVEDEKFNNEIVESEKENLKKSIKSRVNDKRHYAHLRCIEECCKDEPFGIYADGYYDAIDNINSQNIYDHYKMVMQTSPIEIIVIGDEDEQKLSEYIREQFTIDQDKAPAIKKSKVHEKVQKENIIKEGMDVTQGKLCIAVRSGIDPCGENFYKLLVMNEVLGGSQNSKLLNNIREKESLCYYISSFVYRFKTMIFIECGVDEENFCKVVEMVKSEISELIEKNIDDVEVENAKKSLINKFKIMEDYSSSTIDFYLSQYMLGDKDSLEDARKCIENVVIEDISSMAKLLEVDTIYMLGKLAKIKEAAN